MKPDAWMPFYPGDYLADTRRLSLEQHGAYLLLILDYWRNGPPPNDAETLARIVGCTQTVWRRISPALIAMFREEGGALHHKRIDAELIAATAKRVKAADKAALAAAMRWSNNDASSNAPSIPQAMLEQCPSPSPSPKEESKARGVSSVEPEGFTRFWQSWPQHKRKAGKPQCLARWVSANLEGRAGAIVAHVESCKRSEDWTKESGAFVPAPLVYLRQERYEAPLDAPVQRVRRVAI